MREWPNTAQLGDRCSTLFAILGQPPKAEQIVYFAVLALAEMLPVSALFMKPADSKLVRYGAFASGIGLCRNGRFGGCFICLGAESKFAIDLKKF